MRGLGGRKALRRLVKGRGVPFSAARPGTASIEPLSGGVRAAAKARVLARGTRSYAAAGSGSIKVKLTKAGRKKLRRARKARVVLRVTFAAAGEAPVVMTRKVTLRR